MSEVERIADLMRRSFEMDSWHGPAVLEVLKDVSAETAARRPIASAHSIWELVLHMAAWKDIVRRRLGGEPGQEISAEENFPAVTETSDHAWQAAQDRLIRAHRQLEQALAGERDDTLEQPPATKTRTRYLLLHGVVHHDLYHAGQIAILKKG